MNKQNGLAQAVVTAGSIVGVAVLAGAVLVLPLKAQQDRAAQNPAQTAAQEQQTCFANLRGVGLGLFQYAEDYDGRLPSGTVPAANGAASGVGWAGQTYRYAGTAKVFVCPSDTTQTARPQHTVSYGLNANAAGRDIFAANSFSHTVALFEVRGDRVFIHRPLEGTAQGAEIFSSAGVGTDGTLKARTGGRVARSVVYATGYLGGRVPSAVPGQFAGAMGRHAGGANFVLLDGHAQFELPDRVSAGTNAAAPDAAQTGMATGAAAGTGNPDYAVTFSLN